MHPERGHGLFIRVFIALWMVPTLSAAPVIESAELNVRALSLGLFEVESRIWVSQADSTRGQQITHYLVRFQDEGLASVAVTGDGGPLNHQFSPGKAVDRLEIELPSQVTRYVIRYQLDTTRKRVPLFVPEIPIQKGVEIQVDPGSELAITGSTFPALEGVSGTYRARLANIPAFLMMRFKPLSEISWADRFLTVGTVTDVALFLLILGSTAYWLKLRRIAVREIQERNSGA